MMFRWRHAVFFAVLTAATRGAEFELADGVLTIRTARFEATVEAACVTSLTNRLTGEVLASRRDDFRDRAAMMPVGIEVLPAAADESLPQALEKTHSWRGEYDPRLLAPFARRLAAAAAPGLERLGEDRVRVTWTGTTADPDDVVSFAIAVLPDSGDLRIVATASSSQPGVFGVGVGLMNFSRDLEWILPSVETSSFRPAMETPDKQPKVQRWPMPWTSSLVIAASRRGAVGLWMTDPEMGDRLLHWRNGEETFDLVFESVNQAPWTEVRQVVSREIRLNVYEGSWVPAARAWRDHWERTFNVKPIEQRAELPWLKDIRGVLSGYTLPADRDLPTTMTWAPQRWKKRPDIGDGGLFPYDIEEGPELDMIAGIEPRLREPDVHFMVYLNVYNMNEGHPWAPRFWPYRLQSPYGPSPIERSPVYGAEGSFSVHRACPEWQDLLIDWAAQTYERFGIRGFYLDIGGGKGPNNLTGPVDGSNNCQGEVDMMRRLKERVPGTFFSCEYLNEVTARVVDFGMYGKDHWFGGAAGQREERVHPLGGFLYGRYAWMHRGWNPVFTEVLGKLSRPDPVVVEPGDTADYAPRENWWNFFYDLQVRTGMRADYPDAWEPDVRVYYRDAEGTIYKVYSQVRPEGRMMRVLPDGSEELVYWRIKGRRQADVPPGKGIEGWIAYDGDTAIGLDPAASYLYVGGSRLAGWRISALPADTFIVRARPYSDGLLVVELGTLDGTRRTGDIVTANGTAEPSRHTVTAPGWFSVSAAASPALAWPADGEPVIHLAATASPYFALNGPNGVRALIKKGRIAQDTGNRRLLLHAPGDHLAVVEYPVVLPPVESGERLLLELSGGMTRDRNHFTAGVWVDGRRVLEESLKGQTSADWSADLTTWAGRDVLLSFGVEKAYLFRACYLKDPRLVRRPAATAKGE